MVSRISNSKITHKDFTLNELYSVIKQLFSSQKINDTTSKIKRTLHFLEFIVKKYSEIKFFTSYFLFDKKLC